MTIGRKIFILVAAFVFLILATSAINLYSFQMIRGTVHYINSVWALGMNSSTDIMNNVSHSRVYILEGAESWDADILQKAGEYLDEAEKQIQAYSNADFSDEEKSYYSDLTAEFARYKTMFRQAQGMFAAEKTDEAYAAVNEFLTSAEFEKEFDSVTDYIEGVNKYYYAGIVADSAEVDSYISKAITLVALVAVLFGVAIIVFAYLLSRSITKPIAQLVGVAGMVASGDISADVNIAAKAEVGTLADGLAEITGSMNASLGAVRSSATDIVRVADELKNSSSAVASAVTEQASSVQEISSTLTSIASLSESNKAGVRDCADVSGQMGDMATKGQGQIDEMLKAMDAIKTASVGISGVIKVISDIAFQTNILALNAAVEAARAGVHGKGFAVVAEEVRNLAQRSASSVKDTEELIKETTQKVERGLIIANDTEKLLTKIINGVLNMTEKMGSITDGVSEANIAVQQIDQTVQQLAQTIQGDRKSVV
jgi:methyl-accepting chemotaxis protein